MQPDPPGRRIRQAIIDNSLLLVAGTLTAVVWANAHLESYERVADALRFAANDIGMVFFFGLAAKEVYEAMLPGGALSSPRQAAVPVLAAVGGMVGPALVYVAFVSLADRPDLVRGWAIPCATDIAFSYMVARFIFPKGHPAIPFLLLLAIADDAFGLIVLAVFYPVGAVSAVKLVALMVPAIAVSYLLRRLQVRSVWSYVLAGGGLSWAALLLGGFHPALALVPIVPFMPHDTPRSTLAAFEHWWKMPVQVVLLFFGLANAGVPFSAIGLGTWSVLTGLIAGKPLGIVATTLVAVGLGLQRARGLDTRALVVIGLLAGIGFTVALFFTTAAFPEGGRGLSEAKMGALASFVAAPAAIALARALGIRRRPLVAGH
jgi:NhaA family Na+:H+ antiporter